ncbi:MAG TPA: cytochrome c biogenesis protein ResB [Methylococcaceae bacterium]|nr:cytochrome c biogenesis protein ResB [Methylococcaceae bacterium]HIN68192.1 cytochrome c biogenesis protein ResB [Methylococcales bacterium]HIA44726.1 cytochrome c biogenesis protein ResB [Methylococcaceae bacterium]HIB62417.1 cytochrome c biogenesis protein ResB [Methylococcaceae bacterium]HIO12540.1 cytochrome c biogenesis protein ResB [Methylococcales bacterium]
MSVSVDSSFRSLSVTTLLLRFLGSMNFAITLLVAVAIASIIGTVLQQNQPYPDYILKFGPFWFEVFKSLDLFDVYSSVWFLVILGFLVISTTVCIYRNTPRVLKDIRDYKESAQLNALRRMSHHREWQSHFSREICLERISAVASAKGYRLIVKTEAKQSIVAAKKGSGSRLGYIFTHVAIVIICIGGLIDGNVPLKIAEMTDNIRVETRNIPASEVPLISTLPVDNLSFRGTVTIPEGQKANLVFIDFKDGYLVQRLPFLIAVEDFRIDYYKTGQPKSFASDLIIYDQALDVPLRKTISVNHPLEYNGYTIYQSSFGDGGSDLRIKLWPLKGAKRGDEIHAVVNTPVVLSLETGDMTLEILDFRPINVNPDITGVKQFKNIGPRFQYKLRTATGEATEFINYMMPVEKEGAKYYLTGLRHTPAEEFRYWYLPADSEDGVARFMRFLTLLGDEEKLKEIALSALPQQPDSLLPMVEDQELVAQFMVGLIKQFVDGGVGLIAAKVKAVVEPDKQSEISALYAKVLHHFLRNVYWVVLQEEGVDPTSDLNEFDERFYEDAVAAVSISHQYDVPVYLDLVGFDHKEATGLQVTRSPGKMLVFPGCLLLVVGVFCMFYLPQRRFWVIVSGPLENAQLFLAAQASRNPYEFEQEYSELENALLLQLDVEKTD